MASLKVPTYHTLVAKRPPSSPPARRLCLDEEKASKAVERRDLVLFKLCPGINIGQQAKRYLYRDIKYG